ncbi:MAG: nicotinate-nucleotide diphosphorylase (carboxylating), partial [Verrucomicrobiae bacterium]|nr:nicotinate-nucleotide diphosphorylase (carboxylating) [Verrucomicrobiae bacterium]
MEKEARIQQFLNRIRFDDLSVEYLEKLVAMARDEDLCGAGLKQPPVNGGDVSSRVLDHRGKGNATLRAREALVICGLPIVPIVLRAYSEDLKFTALKMDGDPVASGEALGQIEGPARELLMAERVLLNFIQSLSGVASQTAKYVQALADSPTRLL